jgi:hypothetical protein
MIVSTSKDILCMFVQKHIVSHVALVAQGLERSIADRQVPRSNRGESFSFCVLWDGFLKSTIFPPVAMLVWYDLHSSVAVHAGTRIGGPEVDTDD